MSRFPHYIEDIVLLLVGLSILGYLTSRAWKGLAPRWRPLVVCGALFVAGILSMAAAFGVIRIASRFPDLVVVWGRAGGILLFGWLLLSVVLVAAWDAVDRFHPGRRRLLKTATFAAPAIITGIGYAGRDKLRVTTNRIRIPNLASDLQGLRIAMLSDLHMSPLVPRQVINRAVAMANEVKPHLTVVTGDLISRRNDPLDACLGELAALKADAGVLGCLGNHEIYAQCEDYTWREAGRRGILFLRNDKRLVTFGNAKLNVAGVDYQRFTGPYLAGAEQLIERGVPNILLSHNPDVFPTAARMGFDLTLSGHTHGGQVNIEILGEHLNVARFYTPYVSGKYELGAASAYVTRGIGTIGLPVRLNARPEVSVIELCAT